MPQPNQPAHRPKPENSAQGRPKFRRDRDRRRRNSGGAGRGQNSANSQSSAPVPVPEGLVFYCKSCQQIVDYKPKTFDFKYPIENCQKNKADASEEKKSEMLCDLAYGTERSIKHFYKIKDEKFDKERREREERAAKADKL